MGSQREVEGNGFHFTAWDFPLLLALAWLTSRIGFTHRFTGMMIHEMGHGLSGWLGGIPTLPIPTMGIALSTGSRWLPLSILVTTALGWFLWTALRRRCTGFVAFTTLLLLVNLELSYLVPAEGAQEAMILGGVLGELLLPASVLILFHARAPAFLRWDFWRYPLCFLCAVAFLGGLPRWRRIAKGHEGLPMGSALGGPASDGDLSRLVEYHGWTEAMFLQGAAFLWMLGWIALGLSVVLFALHARRTQPRMSTSLITPTPARGGVSKKSPPSGEDGP